MPTLVWALAVLAGVLAIDAYRTSRAQRCGICWRSFGVFPGQRCRRCYSQSKRKR